MPWEKEFIDFSFNGHHISEFGLVATTSSDRYSFDGSPEFEDETSTINGVMGQYYWGTTIKRKKYTYKIDAKDVHKKSKHKIKIVMMVVVKHPQNHLL